MSGRIGILGGMFDPIHRGHTDAALAAQAALGLDRVVVLPSHIPPHRPQPVASSFHRFAMAALASSTRPTWRVSDLELAAATPSYTVDTLHAFRQLGYAPGDLFFVTGVDAFAEIDHWKGYPAVLELAHFVVVSRPGRSVTTLAARFPDLASRMVTAPETARSLETPQVVLIDAATTDVSSTLVRDRLARGEAITGLVDDAVATHIARHNLYTLPLDNNRRSAPVAHRPAGRLHD